MTEIFKTVLILSIFGFGITAILLCLKPLTAKKFPAIWQYYVWVAVLISMIIPVYKMIPQKEIQKIQSISQNEISQQEVMHYEDITPPIEVEAIPFEQREINITPKVQIKLFDLLAYIWFLGVCIYLTVVFGSYAVYLFRKRKNSVAIADSSVLNEVKRELRIKRNIRIRMSHDIGSPLLVGVLFPVVYIPCREIPDENMRMVFLHELTHYKRKDLAFKWLSLFVNAVHWFNPLAYLLCANVSEACEISCDMAVTKNMSDAEQRLYMKTILDLAG